MSEPLTVHLDDDVVSEVKEAADRARASLSEWVSSAIRYQLALATALQARAEEDQRGPLYTREQEDALQRARRAATVAEFRGRDPRAG